MIPLVVLDGGDITLQLESTGSRCRQNEGGAYSPISAERRRQEIIDQKGQRCRRFQVSFPYLRVDLGLQTRL